MNTKQAERLVAGLLNAFLEMGPIEVLDWFAEYFDKSSKAMKANGHEHCAPWLDGLIADVRSLVTKYKPISETPVQRCSQCGYVGPLDYDHIRPNSRTCPNTDKPAHGEPIQ